MGVDNDGSCNLICRKLESVSKVFIVIPDRAIKVGDDRSLSGGERGGRHDDKGLLLFFHEILPWSSEISFV